MHTASRENAVIRIVRVAYSALFGFFWYYSPLNKFRDMKFMSDFDVVDGFMTGKSVARIGDGELRIMEDIPSIFFQDNNEELRSRLIKLAKTEDNGLIVCFPSTLKSHKVLTLKARMFWVSNIYWNRKRWRKYIDLERIYGDTQITRPYIDYGQKKTASERFDNLKRAWRGKKVCIIEGRDTHFGEGNDLLKDAIEVRRILAPARNAFRAYDDILEKAKRVEGDFIYLIALGPTATVLVAELSRSGRTAFDVGHIDVEYEWLLSGAHKKTAVAGKYVNERGGYEQ